MKIEEMITAKRADCSGCAACANICPKNAITMTRDAEGFAYPKINPDLCIKCGRCDATCPALNFQKAIINALPATFVATYQNDKILRHSSAGGVFTALSEIILRDGGVVFGVAFDKNWHVFHTAVRTLDELEKLRGSKYVQSQIGDVYRQVKDALNSTKVLFSGTPCQCAGLKHFLGGDNENLLTVDIICHGTPSPAVWEFYIGKLGQRNEIAHVNFRSKRNGWGSRTEINFFDRAYYASQNSQELYCKLFLRGLSERPSCESCKFKILNGQSDLTIGDAWGVKNFAPEMFDNRGTSVVFVHTPKGADFFGKADLKTQPVKFANAVRSNIHAMVPTTADSRRKDFFADFAKSADKFAVMEKYYYQNDDDIRKAASAQQSRNFRQTLNDVAAQIRKTFKRNILVVTSIPAADAVAKKSLLNQFESDFPGCGVYILQRADAKLVCTENFSLIAFDVKEDNDALNDFAKKYNVTEIFSDNQFDSPVMSEWLKACGLPVKFF